MKKNVLIYINDSLGELDWIAPFLKSSYAKHFNFYIFLNGVGRSYEEKEGILKKYGLKDIKLLNSKYTRFAFLLDDFLNRVLGRVKLLSYNLFVFGRYVVDIFRKIVSYLIPSNGVEFDFIFRDYNLKDSIYLINYIEKNKNAKVVIFPHAVGLQKFHKECPREPIKEVKSDLWLENSKESNMALKSDFYKNKFFASGVPAFDINYKKVSLFNVDVKRVLVITRDCGLAFGFSYEDAFKSFKIMLDKFVLLGYEVEVKHHPRDTRLSKWREIQQNYKNVKEVDFSLTELEKEYSVCFTLFSTAPLFLLSRSIPVIEFSPYKKYDDYKRSFAMHFRDKEGNLTHDLLFLELFKKIELDEIETILEKDSLKELSKSQFIRMKQIFPDEANKNIYTKLLELANG